MSSEPIKPDAEQAAWRAQATLDKQPKTPAEQGNIPYAAMQAYEKKAQAQAAAEARAATAKSRAPFKPTRKGK